MKEEISHFQICEKVIEQIQNYFFYIFILYFKTVTSVRVVNSGFYKFFNKTQIFSYIDSFLIEF